MKTLKIAVAGLVVMVAGLLVVIHRLQNRTPENPPVPPPQMVQADLPAPAPTPQREAPPAAPEKPSPLPSKRQPAPRRPAVSQTQPAAPPAASQPSPAQPPAAEPPAPAAAPPAPAEPALPEPPRRVTLPAAARLLIRTQNTLSTDRNFAGDTFTAALEEPLEANGFVIAEKGAEVEGRIVRSEKAGRLEGVSSLAIELVRVNTSDGQKLSIATNLHEVRGERSRGSDAKKVGVATGIGAIIGAIAGGGKGAAIGAGVGAGAGAGTVAATRGEHAVIPSESSLSFHLKAPVEVSERR